MELYTFICYSKLSDHPHLICHLKSLMQCIRNCLSLSQPLKRHQLRLLKAQTMVRSYRPASWYLRLLNPFSFLLLFLNLSVSISLPLSKRSLPQWLPCHPMIVLTIKCGWVRNWLHFMSSTLTPVFFRRCRKGFSVGLNPWPPDARRAFNGISMYCKGCSIDIETSRIQSRNAVVCY